MLYSVLFIRYESTTESINQLGGICRNFIERIRKFFLNRMQKFLPVTEKSSEKLKWLHSVMTSKTMFSQRQNPS